MRVVGGVVAAFLSLFVVLLAGGFVLGFLGMQTQGIPILIVAALAGGAAAEAAKRVTPQTSLSKVIATCCLTVLAIGIALQFHSWFADGSITWGSILMNIAVLAGMFGSWARWQQEATQVAAN